MVNVVITPAAAEEIESLPLTIQRAVQGLIPRLQRWPEVSGAKPLRGDLAGHYRIKVRGDHRMIFTVKGSTLYVVKVGIRRDVYED